MISEHKSGLLLNRKGEWGQNLPPKFGFLGTEEDTRVRAKRVRKDQEVEQTPSKRVRTNLRPPDQQMVPLPEINTNTRSRETAQGNSFMNYLQNNSENHRIHRENSSQSNTKGKLNQNDQRSQLEGSKKGKKVIIPRNQSRHISSDLSINSCLFHIAFNLTNI